MEGVKGGPYLELDYRRLIEEERKRGNGLR